MKLDKGELIKMRAFACDPGFMSPMIQKRTLGDCANKLPWWLLDAWTRQWEAETLELLWQTIKERITRCGERGHVSMDMLWKEGRLPACIKRDCRDTPFSKAIKTTLLRGDKQHQDQARADGRGCCYRTSLPDCNGVDRILNNRGWVEILNQKQSEQNCNEWQGQRGTAQREF